MFIQVLRIRYILTHSGYHLPIAFYSIVLIHLVTREMDMDSHMDNNNRTHGGFRFDNGHKRKKQKNDSTCS